MATKKTKSASKTRTPAAKKNAKKKPVAKKPVAKTVAKRPAAKKPAKKKTAAKKKAASGLRVVHVLTMNSRPAFDGLSPADRAQLTTVAKSAFGHATLKSAFDWLEKEGIGLYKLQLARGNAVEWDVWIDVAMDNGAVLHPGTSKPNGIGVSGEEVHDMDESREDLVGDIQRALDGFRLPPGKRIQDVFWVR